MLIKKTENILSSEITPEKVYLNRRKFIQASAALALFGGSSSAFSAVDSYHEFLAKKIKDSNLKETVVTKESITPYKTATHYNNFYEFGSNKSDPSEYADELRTAPWTIRVDGETRHPKIFDFEELVKPMLLEERIYRLRCVEAWSMVIPWLGIPLADIIRKLQPNSRAKYIFFETLYDPGQFRGQKSLFASIKWPYREGLRMDEAMNPLAFIAIGMYGKPLPNQNGAPIRLVIPWKYGFKSIKSIVRISFLEKRVPTTWESIAPSEYGFYANVNPNVDHPRWSQKTERRLPSSLFSPNRRKTEMFNGYGEQVAYLYKGMDLKKNF